MGGVNFYSYTLNNPLIGFDHLGLDAWVSGDLNIAGGIKIAGQATVGITKNLKTGESCLTSMTCGGVGSGVSVSISGGFAIGPRCGEGASWTFQVCVTGGTGYVVEGCGSATGGTEGGISGGGGVGGGLIVLPACVGNSIKCWKTPCECNPSSSKCECKNQ